MDDVPRPFDFENARQREIRVGPEEGGQRLDQLLASRLDEFSRAAVQRMIKAGAVEVNGAAARPATRLAEGDRIDVSVPGLRDPIAEPEDLPLAILHEEPSFVVIDKAAGMAVHPGRGRLHGTLANAIAFRWGVVGEAHRPGIVHRLDLETSGVLVVAKTEQAQASLANAFKERTVQKTYRALVFGDPFYDEDLIDEPLGRDVHHRIKMAIRHDIGRPSQTRVKVLERFGKAAHVECHPLTGRTHQIRVHLLQRGHALLGDRIYARGLAPPCAVPRLMLHALRLDFPHPETGERVVVEAPLPDDFRRVIRKLS